jgi:hypothetical protein
MAEFSWHRRDFTSSKVACLFIGFSTVLDSARQMLGGYRSISIDVDRCRKGLLGSAQQGYRIAQNDLPGSIDHSVEAKFIPVEA